MNHTLIRTFLVVFAFTVIGAACAPRVQLSSRGTTDPSSDRERELNQQALENLAGGAMTPEGDQAQDQQGMAQAQPSVPILPITVLTPPPTAAERGEGLIARDDLTAFLENGPQALLSQVRVEPEMEGTAFRGFRVEELGGEDPALTDCGLRVGDVVTAVNGQDISRPEGFMDVWDTLKESDHLVVDIVRRGEPRSLRWNIQ